MGVRTQHMKGFELATGQSKRSTPIRRQMSGEMCVMSAESHTPRTRSGALSTVLVEGMLLGKAITEALIDERIEEMNGRRGMSDCVQLENRDR